MLAHQQDMGMSDQTPNTFVMPSVKFAATMAVNIAKVQLIEWQKEAADNIVQQFATLKHKGCVLRGGTGIGKMYITALAVKRLIEEKHIEPVPGSLFPFPVLWVCPKSIKMQLIRVLNDIGIGHLCLVMTYGQLKSSDGTQMFLTYVTRTLPNGQPEIIPQYNPMMTPSLVVCEEIQKLKNDEALVSKTIRYLPDETRWIGSSATPWNRVADARTTVERCGVITMYNALPCTRTVAPSLLRAIASPKHPDEYSPSAAERLREAIADYIVEVKNVRFKHQTKTSFKVIHFKTPEQRQAYEFAYQEYLEELRKKNEYRSHGRMAILVAMQKFQQKAEYLRCEQMAEDIIKRVKEGRQVIMGSNFVDTCRQVWRYLQKMGFDMDRVGFIVGGQTMNARQKMVDDFQDGKTDVILVTVRSGGEGISLHHDRASTKPRHVIIPLPWSAIDLVQFLGRAHRLTSISPTTQEAYLFNDTIETQKVKPVLERKVRCLAKTVTAKEQFITLFEPDNDDVNADDSEEINVLLNEKKESETNKEEDLDSSSNGDEAIGYEGLESVDELPVAYR